MAPRLFISYRRDDSAGYSGRVHDRLQREFGRNLLFMDVVSIPLGTNFIKVLGDEIAKCDALLAVIGPGWLDARDENGHRRLGNPDDFVRIEIGIALKRPSTSFRFYWRARRFRMPINSWMTSKNWLCAPDLMSGMPRSTRTWDGLFAS